MAVRMKMRCVKNQPNPHQGSTAPGQGEVIRDLRLEAVTSGSPENADFFKWTPSGSLDAGCVNVLASAQFVEGKDYYLDITPAE